ncbi:MAG: hypothetical protein IKC57_05700, partial [Alistipes sp.]|nr:hypothetical protein [Alistipes sp.]
MKRFLLAAVTFVLVAGFSSCTKDFDTLAENTNNDIKVVFSVADKDGFEDATRAVKTGWEAGDKIVVFFSTGTEWLLADGNANNLLLTYDGSNWSARANSIGEELLASASGTFFAVHYDGEWSGIEEASWPAGRYIVNGYKGGVIMSALGNYTIADNVITLPELTLKLDASAVQFSVKNLASVEGDWTLYVNDDRTKEDGYSDSDSVSPWQGYNYGSIQIYPSNAAYAMISTLDRAYAQGVVNGEDLSFFGKFDNQNATITTNYLFGLKNNTTGKVYYYSYAPNPFAALSGKAAYLLPELTLNGDGTIAEGCMWE